MESLIHSGWSPLLLSFWLLTLLSFVQATKHQPIAHDAPLSPVLPCQWTVVVMVTETTATNGYENHTYKDSNVSKKNDCEWPWWLAVWTNTTNDAVDATNCQLANRNDSAVSTRQVVTAAAATAEASTATAAVSSSSLSSAQVLGRRRRHYHRPSPTFLSTLLRVLADDFTYKGLGVSLYKSFLFSSGGIGVSLPLTSHFGWFERHQLPSLSTSVALYYAAPSFWSPSSLTLVVAINSSLRIESLRWILQQLLRNVQYSFLWLGYQLLLQPLGWIATRVWCMWRTLASDRPPPRSPRRLAALPPRRRADPQYSRVIEERVGCSWTWRRTISLTWPDLFRLVRPTTSTTSSSWDYRFTGWHSYAPTVAAIYAVLSKTPSSSSWWTRRVALLGLSTSVPIPDPPFFALSAVATVSGLGNTFVWPQRTRGGWWSSSSSRQQVVETPRSPRTSDALPAAKQQQQESTSVISGRGRNTSRHVVTAPVATRVPPTTVERVRRDTTMYDARNETNETSSGALVAVGDGHHDPGES